MRIRCHLWGCCQGEFGECERCGADAYSQDFRESGPLDTLCWRLRRLWRLLTWPRCTKCDRLLLPWRHDGRGFCSEECFQRWIPF